MGLGKTFTVAAFLAGCFAGGAARRALVVAPTTLVAAWRNELAVAGLGDGVVKVFAGGSAGQRRSAVDAVAAHGGVLLTTYGAAGGIMGLLSLGG